MQSKRHMDEQPSFEIERQPKKQQKSNQDQVHSDDNIFQAPTTLKKKSSLNSYINEFNFQNETKSKKNPYVKYEKLIFLKLIKCIEYIRNVSWTIISEDILRTVDFEVISKFATDRSSRWIGPTYKEYLLNYLRNNLDILRFYQQAGAEIGLDHEKDVEVLIKYQDENLSTRAFNNLGETDKVFQQQIDDLKKNIQDAQQATTRNANQQFITIFDNDKTFAYVLEKSKQLTFNWPSEANTINSSKQFKVKIQKKPDALNSNIYHFKLTGEGKYRYLQYEKLIFLKLIKCIQILHKKSLRDICRDWSFAINTLSNLTSGSRTSWITQPLKNALLTYLDTHQDIQQFYVQIGTEIHLDHEKDIQLFRNYQKMHLIDQKYYPVCQQDNDFQQQVNDLEVNIRNTQPGQNANQQFMAIFGDEKTYNRVLEESKKRTINPHQTSEENTPEDKNLPPETINELYDQFIPQTGNTPHNTIQSYQISIESLAEIEIPIQTGIDHQEMQFSYSEIQLKEDEMANVTNPFYSDSDYYGDVNETRLFNEDQLNSGIELDMSMPDATSAAKFGYQNNNLFARQQSDTRTPILPKTWNPK